MTVDEFMALPAPTKASFVLNEGRELMDRIYIFYIIKLYIFSGMFVELWYKPASNKIDKVLIVELEDVLHLYEKNIDISDLFKNK
jgi:hypothetical protein